MGGHQARSQALTENHSWHMAAILGEANGIREAELRE